jgi:hypothetical protein
MGMQPYPDTPLGEFSVLYRDSTVECEHYFPSDYDEDIRPLGENYKAKVTITQDMVLIQIERLEPNGEMGVWCWRPVRDMSVTLSHFTTHGEEAVWYMDRTQRESS